MSWSTLFGTACNVRPAPDEPGGLRADRCLSGRKRCGMRRVSLLLALTLLACLAVFFTAGAAQAHDTCTHHGNDFGCVSGTHHELFSICDYEGDGRWAYIEVDVWYYGNIFLYDNNSPGCNVRDFNNPAWSYRVCEDVPGGADSCTNWRSA
jgi:hypothetical protein